MENPWECGIEPPGSISHGVSRVFILLAGSEDHQAEGKQYYENVKNSTKYLDDLISSAKTFD